MSVFKDYFKKLFIYPDPKDEYDFTLPESEEDIDSTVSKDIVKQNIYDSLDKNLDFLKCSYNSLINSDIILREFTISAKGKKYRALLVAIDGMVNSDLINDYLLKPLMLRESKADNIQNVSIPLPSKNKVNIRPVSKFNLEDYLYNTLIPQNSIEKATDFEKIISGVNSGSCALIVDTLSTAFVIDTKGFESRSVSTPINETIIRGAQERFYRKT